MTWAAEELVSAALTGEQSAVERLICAIWPACYRVAASLVGDRSLAQDAAQEACIIVYRKVRTLRNPGAFDAWMYRIVVREASRARRRHATPSAAPIDEEPFCTDTAEAMDLWRELADLSPPLREVTVLFYFDDLKSEEIAKILDIPHATVRTRLARARDRLRFVLSDHIEPQAKAIEVKHHAC